MIAFSGWLRCKPNGMFYLRDVIFSFSIRRYETSINEWIQQVANLKVKVGQLKL